MVGLLCCQAVLYKGASISLNGVSKQSLKTQKIQQCMTGYLVIRLIKK